MPVSDQRAEQRSTGETNSQRGLSFGISQSGYDPEDVLPGHGRMVLDQGDR